jgi:tetratricopeptide (TPR) repeat protein
MSSDAAGSISSPDIRFRCLYNLAATSGNRQEEAAWLERYFSQGGTGIYGIIRYTRLMDSSRAIAALEEIAVSGEESIKRHPLLDLELLRRKQDSLPLNRARAEVWLLLGRNPGDEALHEWAAWYFDHQKLYDETDRLLKEASRRGMTGTWLDLHNSLALIREGKTAEGEKILREARGRSQDWRIPANLGRIHEGRRAISVALEHYEAAAALVKGDNSAAAQVQLRISRCLETLGHTRESRRALEYALELDPDNLAIRREIRREIRGEIR